jgi:hypothetical protein
MYVPVPIAGEQPLKAVTNRADMDIAVIWRDKDGNDITESLILFELGAVYQADITLTAKNDYIFDPGLSFDYSADVVESQSCDDNTHYTSRIIHAVYKAAAGPRTVDQTDLTGYIPKPAAGWVPVVSFAGPQYTGVVQWTVAADSAGEESMRGFRATVILTSLPGYTFKGLAANVFSHADVAASDMSNDADSGIVLINFWITDSLPIENINLQDYVPVPMAGEKPVTTVTDRVDMEIQVQWWDSAGNDISGELITYQMGVEYRGVITLTAKTGYAFEGQKPRYPEDTVSRQEVLERNETLCTVDVVYKPTPEPIQIPADGLDLGLYLPRPVSDGDPVWYISSDYYNGTVAWTQSGVDHRGSFGANKVYTAVVTLKPAAGYTLDGLGADSFTHDGAASITYDGDSRTVTIIFPNTVTVVTGDMDLTLYLPAPAAGATPPQKLSVPSGSPFTGTVSWTDSNDETWDYKTGKFKQGRSYTAALILSPDESHTLKELKSVRHNGAKSPDFQPVVYDETAGTVTATFTFEIVYGTVPAGIDLTLYLPAPAAGVAPPQKLSVPVGSPFTGTVSWKDSNGEPVTGKFQAAAYTAEVTLSPAEGYTLEDLKEVQHDGAKAGGIGSLVYHRDELGKVTTVTVAITFEIAHAGIPIPVNLTAYLDAPEAGKTPQRELKTPARSPFTGMVHWTPNDGTFTAGKSYTAAVILTANAVEGYTLQGLEEGDFYHNATEAVTYNPSSNTVTIVFGEVPKGVVTGDMDLTLYLPVPAAGVTPPQKLSVPSGSSFTGVVSWTDPDDSAWDYKTLKFKQGHSYTAEVILSPDDSHTLKELKRVRHNGAKSPDFQPVVYDETAGTATATLTFEIVYGTVPAGIDLTLYLPVPVMGAEPPQKLSVPVGSSFTGTVSWKDSNGEPVTGKFQAAVYTAEVTLSPADGYTLEDLKEVGHDGAKAIGFLVYYRDDLGKVTTVTVGITFEIAHTGIPTPVNLTAYLDAPEAGRTPLKELKTPASSPFTGKINWTPNDETFAAGKSYTAVVILTANAAEGYTLQGLEEGDFYHNATEAVTYNPSSKTVTIVFGEVPKAVIAGPIDLGLYLPVPAIGVAPRKTLSVPEGSSFTGTVSWEDTGNNKWRDTMPFSIEGEYTATVKLYPKSSYQFAGDIAFSHSGIAGEVVFGSGDPVTVSISLEPFMPRITPAVFGSTKGNSGSVMEALDTYRDTYGLFITLPGGKQPESITGVYSDALLSANSKFSRLVIDGNNNATGNTTVYSVTINADRPFLVIEAGMTVTLRNLHITGKTGNSFPVIRVLDGGTLNLENVTITGNSNTSTLYTAGGMFIAGKVNMTGGDVSENSFTNTSGSPGAGGVYIKTGGEFTMTNGKIDENVGSGTRAVGGVYIEESKDNEEGFVMDGDSSVSGNTGAYAYDAYAGSSICSGVLVLGTFRMKGGNIEGNASIDAADSMSKKGAVAVGASAFNNLSGKFIMSGNAMVANGNYVYGPITVEGSLEEGPSIVAYFYDEALKAGEEGSRFVALLGNFVNQQNRFSLGGSRTIEPDGYFTW